VLLEAPLGKVEVEVDAQHEEAWVAVDLQTEVEIEC
jgi:hypothetical protein